MKLDHLSASQMNMYLRCGQQYMYRYIEGQVVPPRSAMTLGSAFHGAIGLNYSAKLESHEDRPVGDVLDSFSTMFDQLAPDTDWQDDDKGAVKDTGIATLTTYQEEVAPKTQPQQVELKFEIGFDSEEEPVDWVYIGYIDLIDENYVVVEAKTSGKKVPGPRHDHVMQVTGYAMWLAANTGVNQTARIDYAVKKAEPIIQSFRLVIDGPKLEFFLTTLDRVSKGIQNELWIPNRSHYLCSEKWCGYWHRCHKEIGG